MFHIAGVEVEVQGDDGYDDNDGARCEIPNHSLREIQGYISQHSKMLDMIRFY